MRLSLGKTINSQVVIHIGLQKTASTFLQHTLWPELYPDLARVVHGRKKVRTTSALSLELLGGMRNNDDCSVPFISCEKLSGKLKPDHKGDSIEQFDRFFEKIHKASLKPKVLIVLRPQADWLESAFRYVVKEGGVRLDLKSYVDRFTFDDLSWRLRIEKLVSAAVNVEPVPYQLLNEEPQKVFRQIARFCCRELSNDSIQRLLSFQSTRLNRSPSSDRALRVAALEASFRYRLRQLTGVTYSSEYQCKLTSFIDSRLSNGRTNFKEQIPENLRIKFEQDYVDALSILRKSSSTSQIYFNNHG